MQIRSGKRTKDWLKKQSEIVNKRLIKKEILKNQRRVRLRKRIPADASLVVQDLVV